MGSHEKHGSRSSRDKVDSKRYRSPKREKIRRDRSRSPRDKRTKDRSKSPKKGDRSHSRDRSDRDSKKDKKKEKDLDLGEIVAMADKVFNSIIF